MAPLDIAMLTGFVATFLAFAAVLAYIDWYSHRK